MLTKKNTVIAGQNLPLYALSFRPTADCWERCWDSQGLGTTPLTNGDSMGSSPIKIRRYHRVFMSWRHCDLPSGNLR